MGHLNRLMTLSILILSIHPMLSNDCPIGFTLDAIQDMETMEKVCVKVNHNETYFEKYNRCTGNMVPLKFYKMKEFIAYTEYEEYWVDYIRSYEYGPFINWFFGDENMGKHVFLTKGDVEDGTRLCSVVNLRTSSFRAVNCTERYPRFCVIPTYENSDLASWNCSEEYLPFMSPIPSCVTAPIVSNASRKAPLRARFEQARNVCLKHDGYLLHRGYIYSNHPEFSRVTERFTELPLGIMRLGDKFFWKDYPEYPNGKEISEAEYNFISHEDFNANKTIVSLEASKWKLVDQNNLFYNVMCEYFFPIPLIHLNIIGNTYITNPLIVTLIGYNGSENDVLCFTDSETYHPTPVSISKFNQYSYILDCKKDGYYWCMLNNTKNYISKPSNKVLYIGDEVFLNNRFAVMICMTWPFNPKEFNMEEIVEYLYRYFNKRKSDDDIFVDFKEEKVNITYIKLKRVLAKRELLIHVDLNCTDTCNIPQDVQEFQEISNYDMNRMSIDFIRNVKGCSGRKFGEIDTIYKFGETKSNDCAIYKCVGDFDFGGYWDVKKELKKYCSYDENYPSLNYCREEESTIEESTTEETPESTSSSSSTTTTITTTTPSPEEQVTELGNDLEKLADLETVTSDQLANTTTRINEILNFENNVPIPKTILTNLDIVVKKLEIPKGQSNVAIIEPNIAIIVGERSGPQPLLGIIVDEMEESSGFENNTIHLLTNDTTTPSSKSEVFVQIPAASGSQNDERLSFVLFKNDNAFTVNDSNQRVNTRVISISMGDTTKFRAGQYIDINFRPYIGDVLRNETKVCAYWDFEIGENGNWSSQGCKLLSKQNNGLDICRCDHLTHFAQIIRPDKDFGDLHYEILSILSYIGCILSLLSLILIGLTGAFFKSWRRDFSNKIWLHLSGSIALLIIAFLIIAFVDVHNDRPLCLASGIIMHYSVLASFFWMLISAVLSYQRLVKVFTKSSSHRLLKACLVGWIIPALPIIILCAVDVEIYSLTKGVGTLKKPFCYPEGLAFWFTIIMPIGVIVLANMILFCIIIYSVFMNSKIQRHGDTNQLYRSLTVSFLLFFLFGLTWIFGLLSDNIVMAYLFCIAATMQGFVLFIFFILGNKKTRDLWCIQLRLKDKRRLPVTSSMSKSVSRGITSNSKIVSLKTIDYHSNTTPKFLSGNFEDSDSKFS